MMKVKLFNKKLWTDFIRIVSAITSILCFILTVIDINQKLRLIISILTLIALIIVFFVMLLLANRCNEKKLKINSTNIIIKYGDIFKELGVKVIAFNEYFDTQVDEKIISSTTLNGIFISEHSEGTNAIDEAIKNDVRLKNNIISEEDIRPYGGKTTRYQLGCICPYNDYFLLSLSHFDDANRAYISVVDYISCLMRMWNEIDVYYSGRQIVLPLLGSGITRFNDSDITPQELLKYIIMTFKASKIKLNNTSLMVILNDEIRDKINLYDIQED